LFIYLTPCVPLSLRRRGGREERGALAPLKHPVRFKYLSKWGRDFREASPLQNSFLRRIKER